MLPLPRHGASPGRRHALPRELWLGGLLLLFLLLAGCRAQPTAGPPPLVLDPPPAAAETLLAELRAADIPPRDARELAQRLGDTPPAPLVARTEPPDESVGSVAQFWYKNRNTDENERVRARLAYRSAAINLWFEEGVRVDEADVTAAARIIEEVILPGDRTFFGTEWQPGIDGDPRINFLYLADIGPGVGGYFSSADQTVTAVNPFSNEREMLYVNLKNIALDKDVHFSIVAHELQHLIHANTDQNESVWLEEGLSDLAAYLVGYPTPDRAAGYAAMPDIQLNDLRQEPDVIAAHYGAAFLFAAYFYEQFGVEATQALVQEEANGIAGVDAVLADLGFPQRFDDVFATWAAANYLSGARLPEPGQGGPYAYRTVEIPEVAVAADHRRFPVEQRAGVSQYGTDFIRLRSDEPLTVVFTGTRQIPLLPVSAFSGDHYWTTLPADRSDMRLTGRFDLSGLASATLNFQTWFDIEEDWDYAYVAVSVDDGASWQLLDLPGMSRDNPQGNSYGPGYTGRSGRRADAATVGGDPPQWIAVSADLTPYAGREILLRFEYVTDDTVHDAGWALDDIAVPELGFADDGETDSGVWTMEGFARHDNVLPQHYVVQLIRLSRSLLGEDYYTVEPLPLDARRGGTWTLDLNDEYDEAVLAISAITPLTREPAGYAYRVTRTE